MVLAHQCHIDVNEDPDL